MLLLLIGTFCLQYLYLCTLPLSYKYYCKINITQTDYTLFEIKIEINIARSQNKGEPRVGETSTLPTLLARKWECITRVTIT